MIKFWLLSGVILFILLSLAGRELVTNYIASNDKLIEQINQMEATAAGK